jgi:hypothetical protein
MVEYNLRILYDNGQLTNSMPGITSRIREEIMEAFKERKHFCLTFRHEEVNNLMQIDLSKVSVLYFSVIEEVKI